MKEILAGIESDASRMFHKKDICDLLAYKGNQHRLLIATVVAVGPQCCGSGLISAYLPRILDGVGMQSTGEKKKTMINGIINIWTWVVGIAAGIAIPHVKKRSLFLFSTAGMILTFAIWTALSAIYNERGGNQYGIGVVAMIIAYNFFYGVHLLATSGRGISA
ncbi:Lactose permease [Colletotrichum trifolii]|uniref:Lactose permease n=1 Tax=Colletotrichum trifolii TaxID=5466 RepID=A0A4R8QXQ0_COLTR|nr:Lactose permease [Colletotrichum trifolii]